MLQILLASGNPKKLIELQNILERYSLPIRVLAPADLNLDPDHLKTEDGESISLEENGSSFAENAFIKASGFHRVTGLPCLSDDSGLCVDALNGDPGIYSARYGGAELSDPERNLLLLENLNQFQDPVSRKAHFACVLCLVGFEKEGPQYFEGTVQGHIATESAGQGGFGYDPVFIEESTGEYFAKMSPEQKSLLSHRGKAMHALAAFLESRFN